MMLKQYKIARRLGARIFSKTQNPKFIVTKDRRLRTRKHPSPMTEYGLELIEKQKMRYTYHLREKQFAGYVEKAIAKKGVNSAELLYYMLESRLDNVLYRLQFAHTRPFARQLVSHGHVYVNGRRVTIPSFGVKKGDVVSIKTGSVGKGPFRDAASRLKQSAPPSWLTRDLSKLEGAVIGAPNVSEAAGDIFNISSVLEYYSR